MKKKEFNNKLNLGKKIISNLDTSKLHGGMNIPLPTTIIITINTKYRTCTHLGTCYCSMYCATENDACKTEQNC